MQNLILCAKSLLQRFREAADIERFPTGNNDADAGDFPEDQYRDTQISGRGDYSDPYCLAFFGDIEMG